MKPAARIPLAPLLAGATILALFASPARSDVVMDWNIKADAIGDYILFRNFIEIIKRSTKYSSYEIDLLGNEIWSDLATRHDGKYITKFL